MTKPKIITTLAITVSLFALGYSLFLISKSRTFQFFGGLTNRVDTDQKVVALTFDDAPSPHVTEVLQILKNQDIKATFYEIGANIEAYPDQARDIAAAGMEVGNHSYTHPRFLLKSISYIDQQIQTTTQLIRDSGYTGPITFRPPGGKKLFLLPYYLHQHHMETIMWDVEPDTYNPYPEGNDKVKFLVDYTLEHAQPGSIILIHPFCDNCMSDRAALPQIIQGLKARGYTFTTVSNLITLNH